jgi:transcriptional regulator with XRE-family HTH domain
MSKVDIQTLRTASGDELVVLSRRDYEDLVALAEQATEDAEDVAIYDARKAQVAEAGEVALPEAVTAALLRGDSLLEAIRVWRGLSQTAVAEQTGLGQGYLSDLEARRRGGAAETLGKLAAALAVPLTWLTPPLSSGLSDAVGGEGHGGMVWVAIVSSAPGRREYGAFPRRRRSWIPTPRRSGRAPHRGKAIAGRREPFLPRPRQTSAPEN